MNCCLPVFYSHLNCYYARPWMKFLHVWRDSFFNCPLLAYCSVFFHLLLWIPMQLWDVLSLLANLFIFVNIFESISVSSRSNFSCFILYIRLLRFARFTNIPLFKTFYVYLRCLQTFSSVYFTSDWRFYIQIIDIIAFIKSLHNCAWASFFKIAGSERV